MTDQDFFGVKIELMKGTDKEWITKGLCPKCLTKSLVDTDHNEYFNTKQCNNCLHVWILDSPK